MNSKLEEPVNIEEKYLYGINIRLNIIIDMLSSLLEVYVNQNNVAIENVIEESPDTSKKGKKKVVK